MLLLYSRESYNKVMTAKNNVRIKNNNNTLSYSLIMKLITI